MQPLPEGPTAAQAAIIGKVFGGWQAPASEVRNRLKLVHVRSPRRLVYILGA